MIKRKVAIAGSILVLTVFISAGGFTAYRALNTASVGQAASTDSAQTNVVQAGDAEQQEAAASTESNGENTELSSETVKDKFEIVKYTVKAGDTLESIAKSNGIKVSTIVESSGISENDILKIGQELQFPSIDGVLYKVKSGETLWDLTVAYDVSTEYIVDINKLDSPDKLKIGQQIMLPGVEKLKIEKEVPKVKDTTPASNVKLASRSSTSSQSSSSKSTAVKPASGSGVWPVKGTVTSKFGPRWGEQHNGIDIAAPTGTDVNAFMSGKVIYSQWNSGGYGYLVKIDHGNGLVTYYGHNSKLLVKVGQYVEKGQHIAEVGSTGYSTGPHCHFEVRKNGVPVNPYNYLK